MFKIGGEDAKSKARNIKLRKIKNILTNTIKEINFCTILHENYLDSPLKRISE